MLDAIAFVERKSSLSWKDAALSRLLHALSDGVKHIAPLTVLDLRTWDAKPRRPGRIPFYPLVILLAVWLMGATWYYTNQYNKASLITSQLEQLKTENASLVYSQTILSILKLAADGSGRPLDQEQYFENVEQLKDIYNRSQTFASAAREYSATEVTATLSNLLAQAVYYVFPPVRAAPQQPVPQPAPQQEQQPASVAPASAGVTVVADNAATNTVVDIASLPQNLQQQSPCDELQRPRIAVAGVRSAPTSPSPAVEASMRFTAEANQILCANGIGPASIYLNQLDQMIGDFKVRTGLLALWILPAFYGALGAMVYYMRRIIDPTIPDPPFSRLLYRVALGSFAGIILGWFWKPDADIASGFGNPGINVFGWAFLVGFSVEVFFALLDRIVSILTGWARQVGSSSSDSPPPPPAPPPVPAAS